LNTLLDLRSHPHRRFNPLSREWVLVSPHRTKRPWQGQVEKTPRETLKAYEPDCYLCPGNSRAGGKRNPQYTGTFVFDNDFAALLPDTPAGSSDSSGLLVTEAQPGVCRVICFTPRHDLTLSRMEHASIRRVIDTWAGQF
jgi:UDPglucose--hexose-1-phosphate uridylyltransferase